LVGRRGLSALLQPLFWKSLEERVAIDESNRIFIGMI